MDINEINATIKQLEEGQTTFDSCHKLAALYTIRATLTERGQIQSKRSLDDIFPMYSKYAENKRKYQLKEISADCLYDGINLLCLEISDFIRGIYSSCDTETEKEELINMIESLHCFLSH